MVDTRNKNLFKQIIPFSFMGRNPSRKRLRPLRDIPKMLIKKISFKKVKAELKRNLLLVLTISGIFLGIILGFLGRAYDFSSTSLQLIIFPGELLLRLLKMLILPLIISSLITGLAQLDPKSSGKMGSRAIAFYISTTLIATITGKNIFKQTK